MKHPITREKFIEEFGDDLVDVNGLVVYWQGKKMVEVGLWDETARSGWWEKFKMTEEEFDKKHYKNFTETLYASCSR